MRYSLLTRVCFVTVLTRRLSSLILTAMLTVIVIQSGCVGGGSLAVSPSDLNFGSVPVGSSRSQIVTIANSSDAPFIITEATVSGKYFELKTPSLPLTLAMGQSANFTTTFAPAAIGSASGSVSITKNQPSATQVQSGSGSTTQVFSTHHATVALTGAGVRVPPSITIEPSSQAVMAGKTVTFLVAASGHGQVNYQWLKNGTSIAGATSTSYTIPAVAISDSGSQFSVVVGDSGGDVTSTTAILTVDGAPGQLTASTTLLNYGSVTIGSSVVLPVTLINTGGSSVSISNVALSGPGLSASGVSSGLTLAAGGSATLNVGFIPSSVGTLNGSVSVMSSANNKTLSVSLVGSAVQPVSHAVTLNLTPNSSSVVGYNVYRALVSNGPYTKLNSPIVTSTTYIDTTVVASQTYFYVGTSVDAAGDETLYSNPVSATIPTP